MTVLELYEKVSLKAPLEQRLFFNMLNDSINEITAMYGDIPGLVFENNLTGADLIPVRNIHDFIPLLPLYHNAVVDNILHISGHGDEYKTAFNNKTRDAFLYYWNLRGKNRKIKRNGW